MKSRSALWAAMAGFALASFGVAAPAAAQNSQAEPPVVAAPPPVARTKVDPPTTAPPPTTGAPAPAEPAPAPAAPAETVVVVPQPTTPSVEPMTIDPDAAYPEGFADPADPFANDMSLSYREQRSGFDWGLLGLLGLLGLIPLFRQRRDGRTVYVERDEEDGRRVVRRRIDE